MTLDELTKAIAGARERDKYNQGGDTVATADRRALLAVIDQLLPDARRYQWLRDEETNTDPRYYPFWNECNVKLCRVDRMDALIDKWMSMDFCEHDNDAADCGICHGQFGVGA